MRLRLLVTAASLGLAAPAIAHHTGSRVIFTHAGTGASGYANGRAPSEAAFRGPTGLAAAPDGSCYVADTINQRVRKVRASVALVAGTGRLGDSGDGGPAPSAELQDPTAVEVLPRDVLIADTANSRVRLVGTTGLNRPALPRRIRAGTRRLTMARYTVRFAVPAGVPAGPSGPPS